MPQAFLKSQSPMAGPPVECEKLSDDRLGGTSAVLRMRVVAALERSADVAPFDGTPVTCNAEMGRAKVRDFGNADPAGKACSNRPRQVSSVPRASG